MKHAWIPIWNLNITQSSIPRALLHAYMLESESSSSLSRQSEYGPKTYSVFSVWVKGGHKSKSKRVLLLEKKLRIKIQVYFSNVFKF